MRKFFSKEFIYPNKWLIGIIFFSFAISLSYSFYFKIKPQVEILDPETYESARLENPEKGMKIGQKVRIYSDGRFWMV